MRRIILHIDRLVLRGFRHEDRHAITDGLRMELGRHLAEPDTGRLLASRGDLARLEPSALRVGPRTTPARIGAQAGQAIGRRLTS